jgi:hypothetical protein
MKPAVFVWSYPNNQNKIDILKKTLESLRKTGFPIISISNYEINKEILELFDDHYTGKNSECCFQNYFSDIEIDWARLNSKYLCQFYPSHSQEINYRQFSYGRGCTYHFSVLSQWTYTLSFFRNERYTHGFIIEGDNILNNKDLDKISDYFNELESQNLNFIFALPLMFDFMVATAWFFKYSPELDFELSCEKLLRSTYPSFACEKFLYQNLINTNLPGKIIINENDKRIPDGAPGNCSFEIRKNLSTVVQTDGINLFFPNTELHNLSSSQDKFYQSPLDPLSYIETGIGKIGGQDVFFCWNRYNGNTVKSVLVQVTILESHKIIWENSSETFPGVWYYSILPQIYSHYLCRIKFCVTDIENQKYEKNYTFQHLI